MLCKQSFPLIKFKLDPFHLHILLFCFTLAYFQNGTKRLKRSDDEGKTQEPEVGSLELESATQEFSFGTPRLRREFQEPSTPEMPDLSSVTQDICKVSTNRSQ